MRVIVAIDSLVCSDVLGIESSGEPLLLEMLNRSQEAENCPENCTESVQNCVLSDSVALSKQEVNGFSIACLFVYMPPG